MKDIRLQFQDADITKSTPEETSTQIENFLKSKMDFTSEKINAFWGAFYDGSENNCQIFNVQIKIVCEYGTMIFLYGSAIVAKDWHDLGFSKENINEKIKQAIKLLSE